MLMADTTKESILEHAERQKFQTCSNLLKQVGCLQEASGLCALLDGACHSKGRLQQSCVV